MIPGRWSQIPVTTSGRWVEWFDFLGLWSSNRTTQWCDCIVQQGSLPDQIYTPLSLYVFGLMPFVFVSTRCQIFTDLQILTFALAARVYQMMYNPSKMGNNMQTAQTNMSTESKPCFSLLKTDTHLHRANRIFGWWSHSCRFNDPWLLGSQCVNGLSCSPRSLAKTNSYIIFATRWYPQDS